MLPLAHTYISYKLTGRQDPLLVLGGILPDISTASGEKLSRDLLHNNPNRFHAFVADKYPELLPLALGALLHSQVNHGADFYSDNHQTGYAYRLGLKLVPGVAKLLERKPDEVCAVLAHNFIEGGVDLNLARNQSEILDLYRSAIQKIDRPKVISCLAEYFSESQDFVAQSLEKLLKFLQPDNYISADRMVSGAIQPLIKIRLNHEVDAAAAEDLVKQSVSLTAPTYLDFLDTTAKNMCRDFAEYLPAQAGSGV